MWFLRCTVQSLIPHLLHVSSASFMQRSLAQLMKIWLISYCSPDRLSLLWLVLGFLLAMPWKFLMQEQLLEFLIIQIPWVVRIFLQVVGLKLFYSLIITTVNYSTTNWTSEFACNSFFYYCFASRTPYFLQFLKPLQFLLIPLWPTWFLLHIQRLKH